MLTKKKKEILQGVESCSPLDFIISRNTLLPHLHLLIRHKIHPRHCQSMTSHSQSLPRIHLLPLPKSQSRVLPLERQPVKIAPTCQQHTQNTHAHIHTYIVKLDKIKIKSLKDKEISRPEFLILYI